MGIVGAGVQLAVLTLLVKLGLNYLVATVVAVETSLKRDRPPMARQSASKFALIATHSLRASRN